MKDWALATFSFGSEDVARFYESMFGQGRAFYEVAAKGEFVRDALATLTADAGNDLFRLSEVTYRLLFVLDLDTSPLNRAIATEELAGVVALIRREPLGPDHRGFVPGLRRGFVEAATRLHADLGPYWPGLREETRLAPEAREAYLTTLDALSLLVAGDLRQERLRLQLVLEACRSETADRALKVAIAERLFRCLETAAVEGLSRALDDDDAHVRETAVARLWALGGRGTHPYVLARLAAREPGLRLVDPSVAVRRRVLQCCWSLDAAAAALHHGEGPDSFTVIHDIALWDPEPGLRSLATACLAHLLGRPDELGSDWVRQWWQDHLTGKDG
ncbi:MAG: hypothetical protein R3F30_10940 [Planctomycetota bacterium]